MLTTPADPKGPVLHPELFMYTRCPLAKPNLAASFAECLGFVKAKEEEDKMRADAMQATTDMQSARLDATDLQFADLAVNDAADMMPPVGVTATDMPAQSTVGGESVLAAPATDMQAQSTVGGEPVAPATDMQAQSTVGGETVLATATDMQAQSTVGSEPVPAAASITGIRKQPSQAEQRRQRAVKRQASGQGRGKARTTSLGSPLPAKRRKRQSYAFEKSLDAEQSDAITGTAMTGGEQPEASTGPATTGTATGTTVNPKLKRKRVTIIAPGEEKATPTRDDDSV
jgi:hypothetical protein